MSDHANPERFPIVERLRPERFPAVERLRAEMRADLLRAAQANLPARSVHLPRLRVALAVAALMAAATAGLAAAGVFDSATVDYECPAAEQPDVEPGVPAQGPGGPESVEPAVPPENPCDETRRGSVWSHP